MRLIIEKDYDALSKWAAEYVIKRINEFNEYMKKQYPNVFIIGKSKKGTTLENTVLEAKEIAKEILENIR